jgi:NADH-quinone oxidoreductase subunit E
MSVRRLHPVQPESFAFSPDNLAWARAQLGKYPPGKQASAVIPLLWRAQEQNDGWLSKPAMEYVARMLDMAFIRVYEVATFYTMFQLSPVGRRAHIQVCGTTPCMLRGAQDLIEICQRRIGPHPHRPSADGEFSWEEVECLGACVNAPMVQIFKDTYEDLTVESFERLLDDIAAGRSVRPGPQNDRQFSAPEGGPLTLLDPALYDGSRRFERIEPPPPEPAAATTPPSRAASPATASMTTSPGIKSPSPEKAPSEAAEGQAHMAAKGEAHRAPEATNQRKPPEKEG